MLDNLKIFNLAMKRPVRFGHRGVRGAIALLHVVEELKQEHVNVRRRIGVQAIMKMLISVAETNAVSIFIDTT